MGDDAADVAAAEAVFRHDAAAAALGIELVDTGPGGATVRMTVRPDMANGHGTCHGGVVFTLADTAFAVACNGGGEPTVAAGAVVDFVAPTRVGTTLTATCRERLRRGRTGFYDVDVTDGDGTTVALFRGRSQSIAVRPPA